MILKKTLVALAILGSLTLAGCSSTAPASTTNTTPAAAKADKPCPEADATSYGDVIPKEVVIDKYGKYCHTTINPKAVAFQWDASKVDETSLSSEGFTDADAKKAQQAAVTFLAEQTLDSSRLDNYTQSPDEWLNNASSIITKTFIDGAKQTAQKPAGIAGTGIIVSDDLPSPIIRNGQPRATDTKIEITSVTAQKGAVDGKPILVIKTTASVTYKVTNQQTVEVYLKNNPTKSKAELQDSNPELLTQGNRTLVLTGNFTYAFDQGNTTQISGASNNYKITTSDGKTVVKDYR